MVNMNQHPPHLSGAPEEGNLSESQSAQIKSIQGKIKEIV